METVIAISIITMCSLIAINLYARIMNGVPPIKKYEYEFELQKLIERTISEEDLDAGTFKFNGFVIEKKVSNYQAIDRLIEVSFLVKMKDHSSVYKLLVTENSANEN